MALPTTMKGLILHEDNSIKLDTAITFPSPTEGSVTIRVLASQVNPNLVKMLRSEDGSHAFTQPRPLVPGGICIGRVVATGPDAVSLSEGQLVVTDQFVRGRDDPNAQILWGFYDGNTPESKKLHLAWRNGSYAEYVRAPLENTCALDEKRLCGPVSEGGFGYSIPDIVHFIPGAVAYGGFRSVNLQAGETVVISPATGLFSGAAVVVALALGANVIAVSRSADGLAKLKTKFPSISTVQFSGDLEADTAAIRAAAGSNPPDVFLDLSPPAATGSTAITACMMAVNNYGRIVLMGGRGDTNIPIPWALTLYRNLTIKGGFMYEREDVRQLIRLVESGRIKVGKENGYDSSLTYKLEEWDQAAEAAVEHTAFGKLVFLTP